jgi:5-hydroxyisourate hydrolase-like protein (transthyretin family)
VRFKHEPRPPQITQNAGCPILSQFHRERVGDRNPHPALFHPRTILPKRSLRCFALILLLALALPSAHPEATPGPCRIAGTVVNSITGEPIARATIALLSEIDSETVATVETDSEGRFALARLPAAKYQLTASKRGFRTAFYDEHEEFSTAIVTGSDQDTNGLIFRISPNAVLHGVITADGGDPVEGARVQLFMLPPDHGRNPARGRAPSERIAQADSASTDDTGAYEFSNLSAGKYMLAVMAEPWYAVHPSGNRSTRSAESPPGAALDVAYSTTFYDSTTDEASATPILLAPGSHEEANIILHAVPALHIEVDAPMKQDGSLARPALTQSIFGLQVPGEAVVAVSDPAHANAAEFTAVAPGHYELQHGDPPRIAELDATVSQHVDSTEGAPAIYLSGTLRPPAGATIPDDATLAIYAIDSSHRPDQFTAVASKGSFRFDSVVAGSWELWAWSGGRPLAVVAISANGISRKGNVVTVRDRPLSIAASVSPGDSQVQGVAKRAGKPVAGAMVALVPRTMAAYQSLIRRDQSDSDGSFSVRDVAPGQYTVVAIEDGWKLDWMQPEALAGYLAKGIPVTVTESSGKVLRLPDPVPVQAR